MSGVALICASCPEAKQDQVTRICQAHKIQKAFGRSGDMVDSLSGKDWVGKWQAKVVSAAVTCTSLLALKRVKLVCIQGGRFCNEEFMHTRLLKAAVEREWKDGGNEGKILVDVHWVDYDAFVCDYPLSDIPVTKKSSGAALSVPIASVAAAPTPPKGKKQTEKQQSSAKSNPEKQPTPAKLNSTTESGKGKASTKSVPSFTCDECSKAFKSQDQLEQHLAATNHFFMLIQCKGCDKTFREAAHLAQHQESTGHRGKKNAQVKYGTASSADVWVCGECEREFKSELACQNHQESSGHSDPECPDCGRSFLSTTSLMQHITATGHYGGHFGGANNYVSNPEPLAELLKKFGTIGTYAINPCIDSFASNPNDAKYFIGSRTNLAGLGSRPDLNGCVVKVESYDNTKGFFLVRVLSGASRDLTFLVKQSNLLPNLIPDYCHVDPETGNASGFQSTY